MRGSGSMGSGGFRTTRRYFVLGAGLVLPGFLLGSAIAADRGTPEEAKALVAKAIAAFDAEGTAAFARLTDPSKDFRDRDLYVFVIGADHLIVAHGADAKRLGIDVTQLKDPDGKEYGKVLAVEDFGAGTLLEVGDKAGGRSFLLPFSDQAVPTVDIAGGVVTIDPPDGLLEPVRKGER